MVFQTNIWFTGLLTRLLGLRTVRLLVLVVGSVCLVDVDQYQSVTGWWMVSCI